MLGVTDLSVFIAGTIAIVLLPGPNSLYVLTVSARSGLRMGYAGALGVVSGDAVLMLLTALGAAQVLQSNPLIYQGVRWAGALYLGYLGLRLVWGAVDALREIKSQRRAAAQGLPDASAQSSSGMSPDPVGQVLAALKPVAEKSATEVYQKALVISVLNPKAILFFLSFFVQFVDPIYPYPALSFLFLGAIVQTASFVYLSALIFGGVRLAQTFAQRKRLSALLSTSVGLLFIAFGARLAG